jgi:hypothetical protein
MAAGLRVFRKREAPFVQNKMNDDGGKKNNTKDNH